MPICFGKMNIEAEPSVKGGSAFLVVGVMCLMSDWKHRKGTADVLEKENEAGGKACDASIRSWSSLECCSSNYLEIFQKGQWTDW